jgi:hypothetical protein
MPQAIKCPINLTELVQSLKTNNPIDVFNHERFTEFLTSVEAFLKQCPPVIQTELGAGEFFYFRSPFISQAFSQVCKINSRLKRSKQKSYFLGDLVDLKDEKSPEQKKQSLLFLILNIGLMMENPGTFFYLFNNHKSIAITGFSCWRVKFRKADAQEYKLAKLFLLCPKAVILGTTHGLLAVSTFTLRPTSQVDQMNTLI